MGDVVREPEHLTKLAKEEPQKRFKRLHRLLRQPAFLLLAKAKKGHARFAVEAMCRCLFIMRTDYETRNGFAKAMVMWLRQVIPKRGKYFAKSAIWNIIMVIRASSDSRVMLESRMQGQLARPVRRGLGRNESQQCDHRAPLPPYITYVRLKHGFVYLAVLMDVYTRAIRGWHLGQGLDQELTLTALDKALLQHQPDMHHSDQGVQYAATAYTQRLQAHGVQISMADVGQPTQNGFAERLMRTIKEEEVYLSEYDDYHDAYSQIARFLDEVYMHKRVHSSLGYLTPVEFEQRCHTRSDLVQNVAIA